MLNFVFLSLKGSFAEVGAWREEALIEQPMGRIAKEEVEAGDGLWRTVV